MDESFIVFQFDEYVKSGLVSYDEKQKVIEHVDGKLQFAFCLTPALARNPIIQTSRLKADRYGESQDQRRDGSDINTAGFEIGEVGSTHFLVANKFCYARPHLMLLTGDEHQRQYEVLNESNLKAVWSVMATIDSDYVAFYNCGQMGAAVDCKVSAVYTNTSKQLRVLP